MALRIEGVDPAALIKRTYHHAQTLIPIVDQIVSQLLFASKVGSDRRDHVISQRRNGANSFMLRHADGREFHFRGEESSPGSGYDRIAVYDRYNYKSQSRPPLALLTDQKSIRRWAATL